MEKLLSMGLEMMSWRSLNSTEKLFRLLSTFLVAILLWVFLFDLDKSVLAQGEVAPLGRPLAIQSKFSGRVLSIDTSVGAKVDLGDSLIVIESDDDDTSLAEVDAELASLLLTDRRLEAQLKLSDTFDVRPNDNVDVAADQKRVLEASLIALRQSLLVLDQQIAVKQTQIASTLSELSSQTSTLELAKRRLKLIQSLVDKGFEGELALLEAKRDKEDAALKLSELERSVSTMKLEIELSKSQKELEVSNFKKDASIEVTEVRKALQVAKIKQQNLKGRVDGYHLSASKSGLVSKLTVNYSGEIVGAGDTVVEIIPHETPLVFYAEIPVSNIDDVKAGQLAKVTLSNMSTRESEPLQAKGLRIDPDATVDEKTGARYYTAVIQTNEPSRYLVPGVSGAVSVLLGKRSIAEYFLEPIFQSLHGALSETQ